MFGTINKIYHNVYNVCYGSNLSLEQVAIAIARKYGGALLYAKSNLSNLFQNSNGTGAVTTTGQPIGLWQDSAMSFNALQATGANKPVTTTINGNFAISYDGTNDFMTMTPPSITNACTIVWAGLVGALGSIRFLMARGANGLGLSLTALGAISLDNQGVGTILITTNGRIVANNYYVISATIGGGTARIFINGVQVATASTSVVFTSVLSLALGSNQTGTGSYFSGTKSLVSIFPSLIPDADRAQIERFGAQRLGITI